MLLVTVAFCRLFPVQKHENSWIAKSVLDSENNEGKSMIPSSSFDASTKRGIA